MESGKPQPLPPAGMVLSTSTSSRYLSHPHLPHSGFTLLGSTCKHTCRATSLHPPINSCYPNIPTMLANVLHTVSDRPFAYPQPCLAPNYAPTIASSSQLCSNFLTIFPDIQASMVPWVGAILLLLHLLLHVGPYRQLLPGSRRKPHPLRLTWFFRLQIACNRVKLSCTFEMDFPMDH